MSFRWLRVLGQRGVLGMNKRNAHYIMSWNPRNAYPKVDDKALTKELASRHGIPTPRTFHVLAHHGEIRHLAQRLGSLEEFVIKPARGAGGSGILLVAGRSAG